MPNTFTFDLVGNINRYGQLSKHYYAGAERIASRLSGHASDYRESEDLEGAQSADLSQRQYIDALVAARAIGIGKIDTLQFPLPEEECSLHPSGSEEQKQCECIQSNQCADVIYWYHPDHLGSSTFLTDAAGQPYQFVLYLPFGETFAEQRAAEWATPYRFNAKELDEETGLYYYGARYYDPRISTWWGVDPLASSRPEMTPYHFVSNNPINRIDPDGRSDDWYLPEGGTELDWANNVTSQASIDNSGGMISGTYIGPTAYRVDEYGNTISYNEDGTRTSAIQLSTVEVTPNTGKFNLAETIRQGTINVLGVQQWIDQGVDGPSDAFAAAGTAMYNSFILQSTVMGVGGSLSMSIKANSWLARVGFGADAGITAAGAFNTFLRANNELINNLNGFAGVFGIHRSIQRKKPAALHDIHGVLNSVHQDRRNEGQ